MILKILLDTKQNLKKAIAYYQGDFNWAQAQLDVLKSSSKLISNDAMALSLLITDNYNLDTTDVPMMLFAKAVVVFSKEV